jgi:hypothetical protein
MRWPPTCAAECEADLSTDSGSCRCMIDDLLELIPKIIKIAYARWLRPCDCSGPHVGSAGQPVVGDSRRPMTP